MSKCPDALKKAVCTMFYTKLDPLRFQAEQSSSCLGDKV